MLPAGDAIARYEVSALDGHRGRAAFVVRPRSTEEVRAVLRWAYRNRARLVPQGANTGLVRAGIPDASGTVGVLSLERCRDRLAEVERPVK